MSVDVVDSTDIDLEGRPTYKSARPWLGSPPVAGQDTQVGFKASVIPITGQTRRGGKRFFKAQPTVMPSNSGLGKARTSVLFSGIVQSVSTSSANRLTAVVQVSSQEDDVLEVYAEDIDRETVEFIKRF